MFREAEHQRRSTNHSKGRQLRPILIKWLPDVGWQYIQRPRRWRLHLCSEDSRSRNCAPIGGGVHLCLEECVIWFIPGSNMPTKHGGWFVNSQLVISKVSGHWSAFKTETGFSCWTFGNLPFCGFSLKATYLRGRVVLNHFQGRKMIFGIFRHFQGFKPIGNEVKGKLVKINWNASFD